MEMSFMALEPQLTDGVGARSWAVHKASVGRRMSAALQGTVLCPSEGLQRRHVLEAASLHLLLHLLLPHSVPVLSPAWWSRALSIRQVVPHGSAPGRKH